MTANNPDQTTDSASNKATQSDGVPRARRRVPKKRKSKPLRLFIGLGFPLYEKLAPLHEDLGKLAAAEPSLRIAPARNLHITLKFLGTLKPEQVPEIHALCAPVCARFAAMEIGSQGIGVFKNSLWVGINNMEPLTALARELDEAARMLGVAPESKPYHPHATVARFGKAARTQLSGLLEKYQATEWGAFSALKCYLYQSETLPEGARYSIIQGYPLSAGNENQEPTSEQAQD